MKAWRLAAPAFVVLAIVTGWPLARALYHSLYSFQLTTPDDRQFVFADNYIALATSPTWWKACALMLGLVTVSTLIQLVIGFGFANILRRALRLRFVVRLLILIPVAVMSFGSAFAWRDAMSSGYLHTWFGLGDFGDSAWGPLTTVVLAEVWRGTGIVTLILFAGLQRVPDQLLQSARADGATAWQRFWRIVLPALRPAVAIAVVYRIVDAFALFDPIYAIIDPGVTSELSVPSTLIFDASINRFEIGLAAAMAVFLAVLYALIAILFREALRLRRAL